MEKGVAIHYIVALVIGIIVVVIMVYLMYRYVSREKLSAEECRARFIEWCTNCRNLNWQYSDVIKLPQKIKDECRDIFSKYFGFTLECSDPNNPNPDNWCNDNCNTWKTKADCCTVGVKNDVCP